MLNVTADRYLAMGLLEKLGPQHELRCVIVLGEPPSKARARFTGKGKPYTPKRTVDGEKRLAERFKTVGTFPGNVAISAIFYRSSRQRVDVDNLLKAVLDAGTRAKLWDDDSQVTALIGILEYDPDEPRAVVAFGQHASTLTRGTDSQIPCEACGTLFYPAGKRRETARWCSATCRMTLANPVECPICHEPFKRRTSTQKYCSDLCRLAASHAQRRAATHCVNGHEYTPENTHRMKNGRRRCRRCQADAQSAVRARRANPAQEVIAA